MTGCNLQLLSFQPHSTVLSLLHMSRSRPGFCLRDFTEEKAKVSAGYFTLRQSSVT